MGLYYIENKISHVITNDIQTNSSQIQCLTYVFTQSNCRVFFYLSFYFMKTTNIPMYGNSAVYIKYSAVCLKIDYTLRCLEYICSVVSPLRHHGLLRIQSCYVYLQSQSKGVCAIDIFVICKYLSFNFSLIVFLFKRSLIIHI